MKDKVIKILLEALEFYADPDTYFAIGILPDHFCGEFSDDCNVAYDGQGGKTWKPGKRAREALMAVSAINPDSTQP